MHDHICSSGSNCSAFIFCGP